MPARLKKRERVDRGLRRILGEQAASAIDALAAPPQEREQGIHDFRVACKRLRATLRLLQDESRPMAAILNRQIGDLAAELSALRDADAMIETLDALQQKHPDWFEQNAYLKAREQLLQQRRQTQAESPDFAKLAPDLQERMRQLGQQLARIDLPRRKRHLRKAFGRTQARLERAVARTRPGQAEDFHRWRKRVKDLLYQGELLRRILDDHPKRRQRALAQLSKVLGEHHDLEVMDLLFVENGLLASAEAAASFSNTLARRKRRLEEEATQIYKDFLS